VNGISNFHSSRVALPGRNPDVAHIRLREILDTISDGYLAINGTLTITDSNASAAIWTRRTQVDLLGKFLFDVFSEIPVADRKMIREITNAGETQRFEMASMVHPGRWLNLDFYPAYDGSIIFLRDVTLRKSEQLATEKAKGLLTSTLDAISSEIAILDDAGCILAVNRAWRRLVRRSGQFLQDDGIGQFYLSLGFLRPVRSDLYAYRIGIKEVLAGNQNEFKYNFRMKIDGGWRNYRLHASRFEVDGWSRVVVALDDVTELATALHDVNSLAGRLVKLQEREQQRYANELHDSTVQHLTAASLNLMALRSRLPQSDSLDDMIGTVEDSLAEAQREIRSVSYLLYPRALDEDGLAATLKRYVSGYSSRTHIRVNLRVTGVVDDLPIGLQRAVLRIVQEALSNVHRHASATNVQVQVAVKRRRMAVCVVDNGRGIVAAHDVMSEEPSLGVGIPGMKARTHRYGGCLKLRTGPNGTLVLARIPLGQSRHEHADRISEVDSGFARILAEQVGSLERH
jgi:two-component system NarL family sensor kinase